MTVKEVKEIAIGALKDGWVEIEDPKYYIQMIKEASKEELEDVLSEIDEFAINNGDLIGQLINEF